MFVFLLLCPSAQLLLSALVANKCNHLTNCYLKTTAAAARTDIGPLERKITRSSAIAVIANRTACSILTLFIAIAVGGRTQGP